MTEMVTKDTQEFELTITADHLRKAIARRIEIDGKTVGLYSITTYCILAQAAMDIIPQFNYCGYNSIEAKEGDFFTKDSTISNIVIDFDKFNYDKIDKILPVTAKFERAKV